MSKFNKIDLYIHLGAEKTGSTFLQNTLVNNRTQLIKNGLLYLSENLTWNGNPSLNHQLFFKNIKEKTNVYQSELAKEKISNWVNFAKNRNVHKFLISWESIQLKIPFIKALTKSPFINIIPIFYVRNQVDWLKSGWKQFGCKIEGIN